MATKKATKKGSRGDASGFVRKMPLDMPASKVVAEAAKQGIKVSESLVYSTRAYDRRTKGGGKAAGRVRGAGRRGGRAPARSGAEEQFKSLLVTIGVGRARELLDEAASWGRVFGVVK